MFAHLWEVRSAICVKIPTAYRRRTQAHRRGWLRPPKFRAVCMASWPRFISQRRALSSNQKPLENSASGSSHEPTIHDPTRMTGSPMIRRALIDHGVKHLSANPRRAVLPILKRSSTKRRSSTLVCRHEQGAGPAGRGLMRASSRQTGRGAVTSGRAPPNGCDTATDALMIRFLRVCITGQFRPILSQRSFPECDTVGSTGPAPSTTALVRDVNDLAKCCTRRSMVAQRGVPARWWSMSRTTCNSRSAPIHRPRKSDLHVSYSAARQGDRRRYAKRALRSPLRRR